ncbi:uncharacterized protein HKW66_Vig0228330 [Vigna angularis]|uniref:Uncharacterized protein n=1 Tax=Phaseolus angularis TaxID=3914 RepID=A0A8T0KAW0_PHAAN|nr:uncharacterized protein HKW66_Vig0228330 [Vigna angularis]
MDIKNPENPSKIGVPPADKTGGSNIKAPPPNPQPELAAVQVDPLSEAANVSADPLKRKRKDSASEGRRDKEGSSSHSASKKARKGKDKEKDRRKAPAVPLLGGIFSPAFSMSDRAKFHMSSSQRALIEPLSELELTNAMLEMSTRTSALAWYLREFANRPGVAEVHAELDIEKKNSAFLQQTLEEMKTRREAAEGLAAARAEQERLAEEGRQLKAEVARLKEAESDRAKANEELTLEVAKTKEQIAELESTILFEHEEGFNKALRQVTLLAGVQDPFSLGVDIEKDVFDGVLVDLNAAEENEPTLSLNNSNELRVVPEGTLPHRSGLNGTVDPCPAKLRVVLVGTLFYQLGSCLEFGRADGLSLRRPTKVRVVLVGTLFFTSLEFGRADGLSLRRPTKLRVVLVGTLFFTSLEFGRADGLSLRRPTKLRVVLVGTLFFTSLEFGRADGLSAAELSFQLGFYKIKLHL